MAQSAVDARLNVARTCATTRETRLGSAVGRYFAFDLVSDSFSLLASVSEMHAGVTHGMVCDQAQEIGTRDLVVPPANI